jgi:hypothetical protein
LASITTYYLLLKMSETKEEKNKKKLEPGEREKWYLDCILDICGIPKDVTKIIIKYDNDSVIKRDRCLIQDIKLYNSYIETRKQRQELNKRANLNFYQKEEKIRLCSRHWASFILAMNRSQTKKSRRISYSCTTKDNCGFSYNGKMHCNCEYKDCLIVLSVPFGEFGHNSPGIYCKFHLTGINGYPRVVWNERRLYKP